MIAYFRKAAKLPLSYKIQLLQYQITETNVEEPKSPKSPPFRPRRIKKKKHYGYKKEYYLIIFLENKLKIHKGVRQMISSKIK